MHFEHLFKSKAVRRNRIYGVQDSVWCTTVPYRRRFFCTKIRPYLYGPYTAVMYSSNFDINSDESYQAMQMRYYNILITPTAVVKGMRRRVDTALRYGMVCNRIRPVGPPELYGIYTIYMPSIYESTLPPPKKKPLSF